MGRQKRREATVLLKKQYQKQYQGFLGGLSAIDISIDWEDIEAGLQNLYAPVQIWVAPPQETAPE